MRGGVLQMFVEVDRHIGEANDERRISAQWRVVDALTLQPTQPAAQIQDQRERREAVHRSDLLTTIAELCVSCAYATSTTVLEITVSGIDSADGLSEATQARLRAMLAKEIARLAFEDLEVYVGRSRDDMYAEWRRLRKVWEDRGGQQ